MKNLKLIKKSVKILQNDGVIAVPTDTLYALAASIESFKAIDKIFAIKGRSYKSPISLLINAKESLNKYAIDIPNETWRLIDTFWPGPLTIVLKSSPKVPEILLAQSGKVGIRIPNNLLVQNIIQTLDSAITGTSVNISGQADMISHKEIQKVFGNQIDLIIENTMPKINIASTVLDLTVKPAIIIREGFIKKQSIQKIIEIEQ
mgnify:CR=1 FL=1